MPLLTERRSIRIACGTADRKTAYLIANMLDWLERRVDVQILDAVANRVVDIPTVYAGYCTDTSLATLRAFLLDVDLSPLVGQWETYLRGRKLESVDRYVTQVRALIPEKTPYFRSAFTRAAVGKHLEQWTGSTQNRHRAALMQFAKFLIRREIMTTNPVRDVEAAPENDARITFYTPTDVRRLIEALPHPYQAVEAVMAGCGAEWQAVSRIERGRINFEKRRIFLNGGKNAWRQRDATVTEDWTWPYIESYAKDRIGLIFGGVSHDKALDAHHEAVAALGLAPSVLHDHRHTYAITLRRRGVPDHLIAAQEGHRDSSLVAKTYGRYTPDVSEIDRYRSA